MAKTQKISQLQPTFGFTEFDIYQSYRESFYSSELGKLYRAFPFQSFVKASGFETIRLDETVIFRPKGKQL